jgi:hypothetical protein
MKEYLLVSYPVKRRVLVDGVDQGDTDTLLSFEPGQHTVRLGGLADFTPDQEVVWLVGTDPLDPLHITFAPK